MDWTEKALAVLHDAYAANKNYGVPEEWLAGLVSVECARLDPKAKRFEPHIFNEIMNVRNGGTARRMPGFNSGRLGAFIRDPRNSVEKDLIPLATSYGLGQIMGYHYLNKWGLKPAEFTNLSVNDSVKYTLRMMAEGMGWARKLVQSRPAPQPWPMLFEFTMRWWNTGSCTGKTYHPHYVATATRWRDAYKARLEGL